MLNCEKVNLMDIKENSKFNIIPLNFGDIETELKELRKDMTFYIIDYSLYSLLENTNDLRRHKENTYLNNICYYKGLHILGMLENEDSVYFYNGLCNLRDFGLTERMIKQV